MKTKILLSIDPGQSNGICAWDLDGNKYEPIPALMAQATPSVAHSMMMGNIPSVIPDLFFHLHIDKISEFLSWVTEAYDVQHLVVEHYVLYTRLAKQQGGSNMPASRVIGRAEMVAELYNIKTAFPKAQDLPASLKHSGIEMPGNHKKSHRFSAYAHGYEYMIKNKMAPSALAIEKGFENVK